MKQKKRKRYLNGEEKRRLKKYVYFFLFIIFISILSFIVIFYFTRKNIINEKTEMIALFSSLILLMIGMFPAGLIGKRIEDNRYYEIIIDFIKEETPSNLIILYEAYLKDIIDAELNKFNLNLFYYPLLFDPDFPEFNFYTYNFKTDTQLIIKFLKDEILYFVGDSKILEIDISNDQWTNLENKNFDNITEIIGFVNEVYNVL